MNRLIQNLCFLILMLLCQSYIFAQGFKKQNKEKISVEKFILAPFTEVISKDSMKTVIFMEIPFSSLQFVKKDSEYVTYYQASISMSIDKGMNVFNKVWLDSMVVKNYEDTSDYIGVSMNIFSFKGALLFPYLKNCPIHLERNEKELPEAVRMMIKESKNRTRCFKVSEHLPDLTSAEDLKNFSNF